MIIRNKDLSLWPVEPIAKVSSIEINPCREDDGNVEQCNEDEAQFYSVYLRYEQNKETMIGGLDCIGDFYQKEDADMYATIISKLLKVQVT